MTDYYRQGVKIGAVPTTHPDMPGDWQVGRYHDRAIELSSMTTEPYVVVTIERNDATHSVIPLGSRDELASTYDALSNNPGSSVYIAMFDKTSTENLSGLRDEGYFVATNREETTKTVTRTKTPWGLVAGVAALGLTGILVFRRKKGSV